MELVGEIEESVREMREYFKSRSTRSVKWRKNQISALLDLLHDQEDAIFKALYQDLGKHPVECYRDEVSSSQLFQHLWKPHITSLKFVSFFVYIYMSPMKNLINFILCSLELWKNQPTTL